MADKRLEVVPISRASAKLPSPLPGQKLIVVEDDAAVRKAIARVFSRSEFTVVEAADAESALRVLRGMSPDVVISDFDMPGMNGIDFLTRVRLRHHRALRVLLTACRDVRVAAQALNQGAAHRLLLKPWERLDLVGIIRLAQRCTPLATESE